MQMCLNNKDMKTLGDRIKIHRESLGFTQDELAKLVGLDQTVISKLERGDMQETTKIGQLSKHLKVDSYWLATGEGNEIPYHAQTKEGALAAKMVDGIKNEEDRQKALKITTAAAEPIRYAEDSPKHAQQ